MHHHARLIFVFLVVMGFYRVGQAGLKLPTSGDPPTSASESIGITSVSHSAQPIFYVFYLLPLIYFFLRQGLILPLRLECSGAIISYCSLEL